MFGRLSGWCYRHRFVVLVVWIAVMGAGFVASGPVFDALGQKQPTGFESTTADKLLSDASPDKGTIVAVLDGVTPTTAATRSAVTAAARDLRGQPWVRIVDDPYEGASQLVAKDHRAVMVIAHVARGIPASDLTTVEDSVANRLRAMAGPLPGASVQIGG